MKDFGYLINRNNLFLIERALYKNSFKKLWVEIGSGNGEYITSIAYKNRGDIFIASEIKWKRVFKILKKIRRLNLNNVFVVHGAGDIFVEMFLEDESVSNFILNFPDPWFKKRHKKRRVLNLEFFKIMWKKLKENGNIFIATDYEEYARIILDEARSLKIFSNTCFTDKWLYKDIFTKYEKGFLEEGKKIYYFNFKKVS